MLFTQLSLLAQLSSFCSNLVNSFKNVIQVELRDSFAIGITIFVELNLSKLLVGLFSKPLFEVEAHINVEVVSLVV